MTYQESTKYKLQADYYESIVLECVYLEDNTVWFKGTTPATKDYKLNIKTNKLYKWNVSFSSWDSIENTLSELCQ